MQRPARLGAVVTIVTVAVLGLAAPALAHAKAMRTSPQAGSTVHGQLTEVSVTFDEAVTLVPHALRMTTDMGIPVNLEAAQLSNAGKVLTAQVQDHLAAGNYAVAWRVQADDGHLETSTFSFSIAGSGAAHPTTAPIPSGPPPAGPGDPIWPVLVAAGIALAGGLGAGIAVRRGLTLVRTVPIPASHGESPREHETLRLPM